MDVRTSWILFFAVNHLLVDCTGTLTYKLNDGNEIPAIALGTSLGHQHDGTRVLPQNHSLALAVQWALEAGYRHVDTASLYRVEDEVGLGVRYFVANNNFTRTRQDVYITTKLWNDAHEREEVKPALKKSLEQLQMDYVDLYLVHYPMAYKLLPATSYADPDAYASNNGVVKIEDLKRLMSNSKSLGTEKQRDARDDSRRSRSFIFKDGSISNTDYLTTWQGMEDAVMMNLTRSIGVSNFNLAQMQRLWDNSKIKPAVLQIEVNPTITQDELVNWCHEHGVVVMGYSPFGAILGRKFDAPGPRAKDTLLQELAEKHHKTVPQILLRYLLDRNIVAIPRSTNLMRIQMNFDIEDFELSLEEVKKLSGFNMNYRLRTPAKWYDHPQFPFEKKNLTQEEIKYIIEHSKED